MPADEVVSSLAPVFEPGSFRDRTARIFYQNGQVFRSLSQVALDHWTPLSRSAFFREAIAAGRIVGTEVSPDPSVAAMFDPPPAAVLRHERIPFVSYPYEWPFGMLRDAALLTLDLQLEALDAGFSLKDATPYNVQWRGTAPVFIDTPSFQKLAAGEPWVGYHQFCELFLYPLFLQAYKGVPFQPWLRGSIDGITPAQMKQLMSLRDRLRPGVFTHVYLQAKLEGRYGGATTDMRGTLRQAGFSAALVKANVARLRSLVASLTSEPRDDHPMDESDPNRECQDRFIANVLQRRPRHLVWDVGGAASFPTAVAATHAHYVVTLDADRDGTERLYRRLRREGPANVLPLTVNLADPSPGLGWHGLERQPLDARGRPDLLLCLRALPHLVIGANVPLSRVLDWMYEVAPELLIEFVAREDAGVRQLLHNRDDHYVDYHRPAFEAELTARYRVIERVEVAQGTRIIYYGQRRPAA